MADTPKDVTLAAARIPALEISTNRVLSPASLNQVKQAIAPMAQQLVQAAGIKLTAAQQAELNTAFMTRGIITIPASADAGNSLNVETNTLTWNSRQLTVGEIQE